MEKRKLQTKLPLGLDSHFRAAGICIFRSLGLLTLLLSLFGPGSADRAEAEVFLAQDQALNIAFPDVDRIERRTFVLNDGQHQRVEARAKIQVPSKLFTFFEGHKAGKLVGYAAIDTHTVRTQKEVFMVVLSPAGVVRKTVILAFFEPPEYIASERWLAQFEGRVDAGSGIEVGHGIAGIVGSTLTTHALTSGVRKVLALFEVLVLEKLEPESN